MQVFVVDDVKNLRLKGGYPGGQQDAKSIGAIVGLVFCLTNTKTKKLYKNKGLVATLLVCCGVNRREAGVRVKRRCVIRQAGPIYR